MKLVTTLCAIFICVTLCNAQTTEKPNANALSLELGKTGLIYNLAFDRKIAKDVGFRLQAGTNLTRYLNAFSVGGGGYYLVGRVNRFFELGIDLQYFAVDEISDDQKGVTLIYPDYAIKAFYPSLNLGYRVYRPRTLFRIGFSPGLIDSEFVPGGFISYGFRF